MFNNKHVIIAMLVAPILAVLAWFAVDSLVSEKAAPAIAGQSYPLVERSNCRYASGICDLENEEFKLSMTVDKAALPVMLSIESAHGLDGVALAVGETATDSAPSKLNRDNAEGTQWSLQLDAIPQPDQRIRLVASRQGVQWFADASVAFIEGEQQTMTR